MNIFTKMHEDREGNKTPIVSMGAGHLVNMVNLIFKKQIEKMVNEAKSDILSGFAPEDMPDKQRRSLGLKKANETHHRKAQEAVDALETELLQRAFDKFWPYIVVGVCRDDTRENIIAILQDVTGINNLVALPNLVALTGTPQLTSTVEDELVEVAFNDKMVPFLRDQHPSRFLGNDDLDDFDREDRRF